MLEPLFPSNQYIRTGVQQIRVIFSPLMLAHSLRGGGVEKLFAFMLWMPPIKIQHKQSTPIGALLPAVITFPLMQDLQLAQDLTGRLFAFMLFHFNIPERSPFILIGVLLQTVTTSHLMWGLQLVEGLQEKLSAFMRSDIYK